MIEFDSHEGLSSVLRKEGDSVVFTRCNKDDEIDISILVRVGDISMVEVRSIGEGSWVCSVFVRGNETCVTFSVRGTDKSKTIFDWLQCAMTV